MPQTVDFPWTPLTRTALDAVAPVLTPELLAHSHRTYALAAAYARRRGIDFDAEGLLAACLFHDLGLADSHLDRRVPFPKVGADALAQHLVAGGVAQDRAELLATAIEFHFQLLPRWSLGPEVGLLQVGAWMDATRLRAWAVPTQLRREVNAEFPRRRFQREFRPRLARACTSWAAVAGLVRPRPRHPSQDTEARP